MKKAVLVFSLFVLMLSAKAQETNPQPQINVNGIGTVSVVPDQAVITATIETKGNDAKEVKGKNDAATEAVLKIIKKKNIAPADFKTMRVALNPIYDYKEKKTSYNAVQTIEIVVRNLDQYDDLMDALVSQGINKIENVVFKSSDMAKYEAEARKIAMKDAKTKAEDYVSVLGQKVGPAILISDNSQYSNPQPVYLRAMKTEISDTAPVRETLAAGEITIKANVSVSFSLLKTW